MTNTYRIYSRAIIFDHQNRVLLVQKNSEQKIAAEQWLFPGGACEWGESAEVSLGRELMEEVGAQSEGFTLCAARTIIVDEVHWQGLYYKVSVHDLSTISNKEPDKHLEIKWYSIDEIPALFDPVEKDILFSIFASVKG